MQRTRTGFGAAFKDAHDKLIAELQAAGIPTNDEVYIDQTGKPVNHLAREFLINTSGEVKTYVRGHLYGWEFTRLWSYWSAEGPGIDVETAEKLHAEFGKEVRVDGHAGCPSPRKQFHGLACGKYHIDTAEGLKALADTIKGLVEKSKAVVSS